MMLNILKRIKKANKKAWRNYAAADNFRWFRGGYYAALGDIAKNGEIPLGDDAKREAADDALKRWVDTGSL